MSDNIEGQTIQTPIMENQSGPNEVFNEEEKELISWQAPERSFTRRNKDFWITAIAILVLMSVILIFVKEFFLIISLVSVLFLYYVLSTVSPNIITIKITNKAIYFGELRYPWQYFVRFWFQKSLNDQTLKIETALKFPRQISLVIDPNDQEKLREIVEKRIPFLNYSPTFVDRLTKWFADRLPLENKTEGK